MIKLPDNLKEIFPPEAAWYGMHVTLTGKGEKYLKDHGIELKRTDDGSCWGEDVFALIQQDPNFLLAGPIKENHHLYSIPPGLHCVTNADGVEEVVEEEGLFLEFHTREKDVRISANQEKEKEINEFLARPDVLAAKQALVQARVIDENWKWPQPAPNWKKATMIKTLAEKFDLPKFCWWSLCVHIYGGEPETWRQSIEKRIKTEEKRKEKPKCDPKSARYDEDVPCEEFKDYIEDIIIETMV